MVNDYFVYMMSNTKRGVIYIGVTGSLKERVIDHKKGGGSKFTSKYKLKSLVYFELYSDPESAIQREKQLKAGSRAKKVALIEERNPDWKDLFPEI